MTFDNAMTVDHWSFDKQNSSFTAPVSGLYWIHFTIGIPSGTMADVELINANRTVSIARNHTDFTGGVDTVSSDALCYLGQGSNIYLSTGYPLSSDSLLQTSFGGFLLDSIMMSPLVAFSFGLSTAISTYYINLPFDLIYVDTHHGWNSATNEYVVPVTGVYVLSLATTAEAGSFTSLICRINGQNGEWHAFTEDSIHSGTEKSTGFILLQLNASDTFAEYVHYAPILNPTI